MEEPRAFAARYVSALENTLVSADMDEIASFIKTLEEAHEMRRSVFIAGNGGSAAIASHFAADLNKTTIMKNTIGKKRFKCFSLADAVPLLSAWANDSNYADVFEQQLENFAEAGDVFIAISSSGDSENIVRAAKRAKAMGCVVLALVGFSGGRLKKIADVSVSVKADRYELTEDAHSAITHLITNYFREKFGTPVRHA